MSAMSAIERAIEYADTEGAEDEIARDALVELRALQERVEVQRKMLKRLETETDDEGTTWCNACMRVHYILDGGQFEHAPDCELAALLKEND